jgi:hypothetical protein
MLLYIYVWGALSHPSEMNVPHGEDLLLAHY